MTCARKHFAPRGLPGRYHCIARCVRRAWLCGDDPYSGKNFDHRRQWVEDRIRFLADLFAVSVMSYAVMSNHLHVVLELRPDAAEKWTAEDVADRWIRLFPSARERRDEQRREILLSDPEALSERRMRLMDLSWFMRCLDEHIARKANDEDDVTGRFWEGRFKCQVLESEQALCFRRSAGSAVGRLQRCARSASPANGHRVMRGRMARVGAGCWRADPVPPGWRLPGFRLRPARPTRPCATAGLFVERTAGSILASAMHPACSSVALRTSRTNAFRYVAKHAGPTLSDDARRRLLRSGTRSATSSRFVSTTTNRSGRNRTRC